MTTATAAPVYPWTVPEPTGSRRTHHVMHVVERHRITDVTELIDRCISAAAARGLSLYCYRERLDAYRTTSWYSAHPSGQPAPLEPEDCAGPVATLLQHPGKTPRCEAYRELSKLLAALQA